MELKNNNDMKNFLRTLAYAPLVATMVCSSVSCTEQDEVFNETGETISKTCTLDFNVSRADYDDASSTRTSTSTTWSNGDKVYLTFENNAYGVATYQLDNWSVEYYGNLTKDKKGTCKAVYFSNPKSREEFQAVNLTHETAIYEDTLATCLYDGSLITITANLQTKTGSLRFNGNFLDTIQVYGLLTSTRYSVYKGEYSDTVRFIELIAKSDGYTPYIYGSFADTIDRRLNVATSKSAYTRTFDDSIMNKGKSGWMSIPTDSAHTAWREKMIFKVKTTEFAMMPVTEGGYLSFLIGETEVTKGLYNAVTDSVILKSDYPQTFSTYKTCTIFLNQMKSNLGITFSLPTKEQWEWTYKGGENSKGYTYSGSNIPEEVGWYKGNSEGKAHKVATLMPNELGVYDMFGNLGEWELKTSSSSYHYARTSSFSSNHTETDRSGVLSENAPQSNIGIRLTLSFK